MPQPVLIVPVKNRVRGLVRAAPPLVLVPPVALDAVDVPDDPAVLLGVRIGAGLAFLRQGAGTAARPGLDRATGGLLVEAVERPEAGAVAERVAAEEQHEDDADDPEPAAADGEATAATQAAPGSAEVLDL